MGSIASASFTRPADTTAYASGDLVANSTTAGSVAAMTFASNLAGGSGKIVRARLRKSDASVTNAAFRLHLYSTATITAANGDNGAWSTNAVASYLGFIDVTADKAFTDGAFGQSAAVGLIYALADGGKLYGLLEARGAYTPASAEIFTVTLEVE
jgi:hypothetical protein